MKTQQIPHHVVTEFIGQASFSRNAENDVYIAEQVASNTYSSLEDLYRTCKAEADSKFYKAWDKAYKEALKPESWFQAQLK